MSRASQFMLQGVLIAMCAAFGSTMAASLFLANAGAAKIPVYYVLFAIVSIPLSVLFSGVIDRWPRRVTLAFVLVFYMVAAALMSLFVGDGVVGYYALYVVISVVELMMYSIYYTIFSDYFTVGEAKRNGGAMTIALGLGAAIGSLLVSVLAELAEPRRVFLALPLLVGLTLAHLVWLTRREEPLDEVESAAEEGLIESLKALPKVARRYPIVLLMAAAVFVNIIGQCVMEFEAFSIYASSFPDEAQLAAFLGRMTAAVDVIGILIVFFVANPLIPRIGVARMNLVPPAINFVSFLFLSVSSGLPAGVLAHLNYYPLEHSLNVPVFSLTYNAVPRRFVGRVRVSNDGVIYPFALAASGVALLLLEHVLSLSQVAVIGAAMAMLYLAAQWGIGQQYVRSLIEMLRGGVVELDQLGDGFKLPDEYTQDVLVMLNSQERDVVVLGFELASRCDVALARSDYERALPIVGGEVGRSALAAFCKTNRALANQQLRMLADSSVSLVRALALEILVVERFECEPSFLKPFLADRSEMVRAIATASLIATVPAMSTKLAAGLAQLEALDSVLAALRVLRAFASDGLSPALVEALGTHAAWSVRAEALSVAAMAGTPGDAALLAWGRRALDDPETGVRAAAATLMVRAAGDEDLARVCHEALADGQAEVRLVASLALGRRGGRALAALASQLRRGDPDIVGEVMDGIAMAGPEAADSVLFAFLAEAVFPTVTRNLELARKLPSGRAGWCALEIAVADSNARAVHMVLHALGVLGYKRVLGVVRRALRAGDSRTRANAVETLSSLAHRRYVLPLLPLLEAGEEAARAVSSSDQEVRGLLTRLMAEDDPFICAGAMMAWHAEFGALARAAPPNRSPLVVATFTALTQREPQRSLDEELPMNRLVFLKSVPLFSSLTLDHLMAVDAAMTREPYLPSEPIVREGDAGDKLFIVFKGEVAIRKRVSETEERELARLTAGHLFGEMALFDDERRSATVVAVTDTELLALDREHFHSLAYQRPDIPIQVCKVLVARLRSAIS